MWLFLWDKVLFFVFFLKQISEIKKVARGGWILKVRTVALLLLPPRWGGRFRFLPWLKGFEFVFSGGCSIHLHYYRGEEAWAFPPRESHLKQQLGCNHHVSLSGSLKSFYLLCLVLHRSTSVKKKNKHNLRFASNTRFLSGSLPRAVISLTLAPIGVCHLPTVTASWHSTAWKAIQGDKVLVLVARWKGQGAAISSISVFGRDMCG